MSKWKLYVWEDVLCDYTCGMAFAVARNKEEAIKAATEGRWGAEDLRQTTPTIHQLPGLERKRPFGYSVSGGG